MALQKNISIKKLSTGFFLALVVLLGSAAHPSSAFTQIIATGAGHTLSLCSDSTVWAWGLNNFGQLGDSTKTNKNLPVQVTGLQSVMILATAGVDHSYVLKRDGTVWAWGNNASGQLGDNTSTDRLTPIQVHGEGNVGFLQNIGALACGHLHQHSLALSRDSTAWAWGQNGAGQLGDGTKSFRLTPVKVQSLTGIVQLAGGDTHSMALRSDSTVWTWGGNLYGQLGDGTTVPRSVPGMVNGLSGIVQIAAGINHSAALKSDGTVWSWGDDSYGQLGDGANSNSPVPVQAYGLTGIVAIAAGELHVLALKNDGTVWAWGLNDYGQLGDSTTLDKKTAVQVKHLSGVTCITGGRDHSLAITADGTRWGWGMNTYGQLGNGTNGTPPCNCSTTPVQTAGLCLPTGQNEPESEKPIIFFPNPSDGKFEVRFSQKISEIRIYTMQGSLIYSAAGKNDADISYCPDGLYLVQVSTGGTIVSGKILVVK